MASNTRGRLKERFRGIHKNFEWIVEHCQQSMKLIKDFKPELSESIQALQDAIIELDKLAQGIHDKL